jgi:hypothetical protein
MWPSQSGLNPNPRRRERAKRGSVRQHRARSGLHDNLNSIGSGAGCGGEESKGDMMSCVASNSRLDAGVIVERPVKTEATSVTYCCTLGQ